MINLEGIVNWFDTQKGYGFIKGEDGKEYFVHVSELPDQSKGLIENQKVSFEPGEGDRGPVAKSVTLEV